MTDSIGGLDDKGQANSFYTDGKHLYRISFGLYRAAADYQATHDLWALELAKKTSRWVEDLPMMRTMAATGQRGKAKLVTGDPGQVTLQGVQSHNTLSI